ncbi:hypothetical protein [uncultured Phycicoccus sp.]|uniref:hypothetical protein n=1 Tax=uncultured Phycicoccus sp. TaxID=661422 RepID=UPI0026392F60|nr:hypothetical protein [uncultured Phycicoccus sp.]
MTSVSVRSDALANAAARLGESAEVLRCEASAVASALVRCRSPGLLAPHRVPGWVHLEARGAAVVGPGGLWGAGLALDVLAVRLAAAARGYQEVERGVAAVLRAVGRAADVAARGGLLTDGDAAPVLREVRPRWAPRPLTGPADLVALGAGLEGGRVRVLELDDGSGGSAWVVVVPGTQSWDPRAGAAPFDLTSDVRALTGDATVAGAGVAAALERAKAASGRAGADDPVLLVGHSQGGIHAAALASDRAFTSRHRVTHVLATGAPVGAFPLAETVRMLSVEHREDPVPALDLTPSPDRDGWVTVRAGDGPALDVRRHALDEYVHTVRAAQGAPPGTVRGLGGWAATAGAFLHRPVRVVTEVVVERAAASLRADVR